MTPVTAALRAVAVIVVVVAWRWTKHFVFDAADVCYLMLLMTTKRLRLAKHFAIADIVDTSAAALMETATRMLLKMKTTTGWVCGADRSVAVGVAVDDVASV